MYPIGTLVRCVKRPSDGGPLIGDFGIVRTYDYVTETGIRSYGVEWFGNPDPHMHSLRGVLKSNSGWFVNPNTIERLPGLDEEEEE